ncbi:MAG: AMP nucleosidase, partial [Beijerinckiaceae bacterium]
MTTDNDNGLEGPLAPEEAVDRLHALYTQATGALRQSLDDFFATREPPTAAQRARFKYPELLVRYDAAALPPSNRRAFAKLASPGVYATTVSHPGDFRTYLLEQLQPLVAEYGAQVFVRRSTQDIPYPYVFERGDELGRGGVTAVELARYFPVPMLASVGDEIADSEWQHDDGVPRPLALFDAVRVDFSLRRLVHYTGSDWRHVQPWILLTNYHRYVDQFIKWGLAQLQEQNAYQSLILPGDIIIKRGMNAEESAALIAQSMW